MSPDVAASVRARLLIPPPARFGDIGERIIQFLGPVRESSLAGQVFASIWLPGGPWRASEA